MLCRNTQTADTQSQKVLTWCKQNLICLHENYIQKRCILQTSGCTQGQFTSSLQDALKKGYTSLVIKYGLQNSKQISGHKSDEILTENY